MTTVIFIRERLETGVLKWIFRIGFAVLAVLVAATGVLLFLFFSWRSDIVARLEAGSEVAETARGEIEYAIAGEGAPYLLIHGTPGGYDLSLARARAAPDLAPDGMTVAVSRPGYLRTPLSSGRTPEEQADLYVALLDELGLDRVIVIATSGGGPSGLQFALRHPERCRALVLFSPLIEPQAFPEDTVIANPVLQTLQEVAIWLAGERLAGSVINGFDDDNPEQVAIWNEVALSVVPVDARLDGLANDLEQYVKPEMADWPLEQIEVPTLIVHGNADANAPYEASRAVAARIPNAELATFEGGDHFIYITRPREVQDRVRRFVAEIGPED